MNEPECVSGATLYSEWFAFRRRESTNSPLTDLILTKFGSGEEKIIVPGAWLPISPDLSERYLVFVAQEDYQAFRWNGSKSLVFSLSRGDGCQVL